MAADGLATQEAKTSTVTILNLLVMNNTARVVRISFHNLSYFAWNTPKGLRSVRKYDV